ncbi:MAG: DUF1249 domain-containing protein [Gammaproteobacteria bacterium]|nr:DUF1249 domain-containing protein [Gammaproteobacteria bacterium]
MLLDHQIVPQTIVKPKSFVGLMAMYESNYLRLLQLIPELERLDGCFRSRVAGDCELYVEILERCRYTVTLSLTYYFENDEGRVADPDITVRAYLDGQLAEAMNVCGKHRHTELRRFARLHRRELDARWQRNVVLNKWLEYLSHQGHLVLER